MTTEQRTEELQEEIAHLRAEIDEGHKEWATTGNGPSGAYLEQLGHQLEALLDDLAEQTGHQPA